MTTTYLLWDIDGTLLTTARAGIFAWEEAAVDVLGREVSFADLRTAGLTDAEIALLISRDHGAGAPAEAARLLHRYAELLPGALPRRQGTVLPNVEATLDEIAGRTDVVSLLLTGNVAAGAEAKLRHYGLWHHFEGRRGAFSVEGSDRPSIARVAREIACEHAGAEVPGERLVVIGDTPHDVSCGRAIAARTVAVATGPGYGLEELEAAGADVVLPQLPPRPTWLEALCDG